MRTLFVLWAAPLVLFWGWFFLSLNDINFGYVMLSRRLHDLVFELYGEMLGIDPAVIPGMVARACVFDLFLVLAIWAFRRRRTIMGWVRRWRATALASVEPRQEPEGGQGLPAE